MAVVIKKKEETPVEAASTKVHKVPTDPEALKAYRAANFAKWYESKGRKAHSERRKKKYDEDPVYREQVLARNREVKQRIRVPSDGRITRFVDGAEILVFRIGQVAEQIGKSVGIIRDWEKDGTIPAPSFEDTQRLYTERQVGLLKELADATAEAEGSKFKLHEIKEAMRPTIYKRWNSKED